MQFVDAFKLFLKDEALSFEQETVLLKEIKRIIYFVIKGFGVGFLEKIYQEQVADIQSVVMQEVLINLYKMRDGLLLRFGDNGFGLKSYIKAVTRNVILNKIREKEIKIVGNEDAYKIESVFSKIEIELEAREFVDVLRRGVTDNELYALCYYLLKRNRLDKGINSLDKAVSRLKIKLKDLAIEHKFSFEAVSFALNDIIVSEICNKFV